MFARVGYYFTNRGYNLAAYVIKRILYVIPTLFFISIVAFAIIQLPPGDYLTTHVARLRAEGGEISEARLEILTRRYGLDQPIHVQYGRWIGGILLRGDMGYSFEWNRPVSELIWGRLQLTFIIALSTMVFSWIVAFVIGLYSATHQYSVTDYLATLFGFIGLATPNFMLALILMWIAYSQFGITAVGLFASEFVDQPWSWGKFASMLERIWIPVVVIGTAGTAGLIRILRANLLDELGKLYVVTGLSKGMSKRQVVFKYPLRIALIPFVSTAGWTLARLISGTVITAIVLGLPTTGPLLLRALQSQDMYLAGSFIMLLSVLTVIGTLISDLLLGFLDPRIRYE